MQSSHSSHRLRWRARRFWRLFRRQKPAVVDLTHSYENLLRFPRLPITVPPLVPTLMSYRWNDEDDCESSPKKPSRDTHYQQQLRRRLPKRYSDIVSPTMTRVNLPRKELTFHEKPSAHPLSPRHHHRSWTKPNDTDDFYIINASTKKSNEIIASLPRTEKYKRSGVTRRYSSSNKRFSTSNTVDLLAQRMQAAMSTELMHSLDRNFVFIDKKQAAGQPYMNRSYSFNIVTPPSSSWWQNSAQKEHHYHIIPRVNQRLDDGQNSVDIAPSVDEPTPDYDEEIVIHRAPSDSNDDIGEEPIADYDDPQSLSVPEHEEVRGSPPMPFDLGVATSFVIPHTTITPSSEACTEENSLLPPTPPPLPSMILEQRNTTFRCRTIADKIGTDHKLILKDDMETKTTIKEETQSAPQSQIELAKKSPPTSAATTKPCHLHLSQELLQKTTLRKVSHPVSRSYSIYGSMSHLNDHDMESITLRCQTATIDEQTLDGLSSSATTSIAIDNEYEHRSSSKIYNDYKRRASSINVSTTKTFNGSYRHSSPINPIHTHIGLRSSTSSSSTIDKPTDLTLLNKQMNVGVINQLNEHLSTRFRKQQQEICSRKSADTIPEDATDQRSYDHLRDDLSGHTQTNLYDEPQHTEITQMTSIVCSERSVTSIPPPPPPLPVGGFRSVAPQTNRPFGSQQASSMTLARETNGQEHGCSTGTSTISSKLSDSQILQELRTNPLFTKAKQYLEMEPGSNGRRSGRRLNQCSSYQRLDACANVSASLTQLDDPSLKSFLMCPTELTSTIDNLTKPIKSTNTINANNEVKRLIPKAYTKSLLQNQCRQSELELIFQKRAQRSEQNLS